ncbi:MAG: HAD-IA family hydrolase [Arenicellales bacterium]|nr:HAD-IA family hydrolase [Arenicellales bacterium]|tara:strand:- start:291 stop:1007 length:717 start_codon:yes stop_codon:yes gene_type:complete
MKHIRAVSLDLDDTLWSIWPVIRRAEAELYRHMSECFPRITRHYDADDLRRVREEVYHSRPDIAHDLTESRRMSFEVLLSEHGYDTQASHDLIERFLDLRHQVELYPDVVPALERINTRFEVVALSNGNADVARLGIGCFFKAQISASEAGVKKPAREIFHLACATLETEPDAVLHVGDHPLEDVIGAQQAGLTAVWMNRSGDAWSHEQQPHLQVSDLAELAVLLIPENDFLQQQENI